MKKYIQPSAQVMTIVTSAILADSPALTIPVSTDDNFDDYSAIV